MEGIERTIVDSIQSTRGPISRTVRMTDDENTIINIFDKVESSEETPTSPILSLTKTSDGSYSFTLTNSNLFQNVDRVALDASNNDLVLTSTDHPSINFISSDSFEIEFLSTSGQQIKLKVSGQKVVLKINENEYSYKAQERKAFTIDVSKTSLSEIIGQMSTNPLDLIANAPKQLVWNMALLLKKNESVTYGDYQITNIDSSPEGENNPCFFVTKTHPIRESYLFINGTFRKCNGFIRQYEINESKQKVPTLILQCPNNGESSSTEAGSFSYYKIQLPMQDGSLTDESKTVLSQVVQIATDITPSTSRQKFNGENKSFVAINPSRKYEEYKFSLTPPEAPAETEESNEPQEESEPEKKEPEIIKIKQKPVKVDLEKPVEVLSTFAQYSGLFLFAGAVLTPIGAILAPVGLAVFGSGILGSIFADRMKFKFMRKAKYKIKYYEDSFEEEKDFLEKFLENEAEVSKAQEKSAEQESSLLREFEEDPILAQFSELYNDYGIGFSRELELAPDIKRTNLFCRYEGLAFRQDMLKALQSINTSDTEEKRTKQIETFIDKYFHLLPGDKKDSVIAMFSAENQPSMAKLREALKKTNDIHREEQKKRESQTEALSELSDDQLKRIAGTSKMNSAQRDAFFRNYSPYILQRFAAGNQPIDIKIASFLSQIPEEDRQIAIEHLDTVSKIMNSAMKSSEARAEKIKLLKQGKNFAEKIAELIKTRTLELATEGGDKPLQNYVFKQTVEQSAFDYFVVREINLFKKSKYNRLTHLQNNSRTLRTPITNLINSFDPTIFRTGCEALQAIITQLQNPEVRKVLGEDVVIQLFLSTKEENTSSIANLITLTPEQRATSELSGLVEALTQFQEFKDEIRNHTCTQLFISPGGALDILEREVAGIDITNTPLGDTKNNLTGDATLSQRLMTIKKKLECLQESPHKNYMLEFVNLAISGQLTNSIIQQNLSLNYNGATYTAESDVSSLLSERKKELQQNLSKYEKALSILSLFDQKDDLIRTYNQEFARGTAPAEALKIALVKILGPKQYEQNSPTYRDLIQAHIDPAGFFSLEGLVEDIDGRINLVKTQTNQEILSTQGYTGKELAKSAMESTQEGKKQYDSIVAMLVEKTGKSQSDIMEEYKKQKCSMNRAFFKAIGIQGRFKEKQYNQWISESGLKGYSFKAEYNEYVAKQAVTEKTGSMNTLMGNIKDKNLYSTFSDTEKALCTELGLTEQSIITLQTKSKDDIETILDVIIKKRKSELEDIATQEEIIASMPTEDGRKYVRNLFKLETLQMQVEEFIAKLKALTEEMDTAIAKKALEALEKGDMTFFLENPSFTNRLNGKYFFSGLDKKLIKKLGLSNLKELWDQTKREETIKRLKAKLAQKKAEVQLLERKAEEEQANLPAQGGMFSRISLKRKTKRMFARLKSAQDVITTIQENEQSEASSENSTHSILQSAKAEAETTATNEDEIASE